MGELSVGVTVTGDKCGRSREEAATRVCGSVVAAGRAGGGSAGGGAGERHGADLDDAVELVVHVVERGGTGFDGGEDGRLGRAPLGVLVGERTGQVGTGEVVALVAHDREDLAVAEAETGTGGATALPVENYWGFIRSRHSLKGLLFGMPVRFIFWLVSRPAFGGLRASPLNPWLVVMLQKAG